MVRTNEYPNAPNTNVAFSTVEQTLPSLRSVLRKVKAAQSQIMEPQRFKQISAEIRDNLGVVLTLQEFFANDRLDLPPRLWERSRTMDRKLDSLFGELCDIVECATQLDENEHERLDTIQSLIARLAGVYHELCWIDQEESDLLFESFWQDIGVGFCVVSALFLSLVAVAWSFSTASSESRAQLTSETQPVRRVSTGHSNEWHSFDTDAELAWLLDSDSPQNSIRRDDKKNSGREALELRLSIYEDSAARNADLRKRMATLDATIQQRREKQAEAVKKLAAQYERNIEQRKRRASQLVGSAWGRGSGNPATGPGRGGRGARNGNAFRSR